ncbi:MAG: fimbria/pilus outer membrane usher protein [Hyphomonadaceae bacterium]|nr:fimbria/pilus outer membrane usher protein [Hyphomonadaceae bacterium]
MSRSFPLLRRFLLAILSCAAVDAAAAAAPEGEPAALLLESAETGRSTEAYAVIRDGQIFVAGGALADLGLSAFIGRADEWISLTDAPEFSVRADLASGRVSFACTARCYAHQRIGAAPSPAPVAARDSGAFFNVDAAVTHTRVDVEAAGLTEIGVFGAAGFGEAAWTVRTGAETSGEGAGATRLETRWTWDDPMRRIRYRIGDSIARQGAISEAVRFAGFQVARDFTLEPGFVTAPTPTLSGVAALPSVVDLYVDGALRLRERIDAGPFTIVNPPTVTGAGTAQVVVTDALGRQQVLTEPFYGGRALLKPGLSDFALSVGVLRERFARASDDYAGAIASGMYRRGVSPSLTLDVRADATGDRAGVAVGGSWTPGLWGQFDVSLAQALGAQPGAIARVGWSRGDDILSFGASVEAAEAGVARVGSPGQLPRTRTVSSAGVTTEWGSLTLSGTHTDRRDGPDTTTIGFDVMPAWLETATVSLGVLYTEQTERALSAAVTLTTPLGAKRSASTSLAHEGGRLSVQARAQQVAQQEGGLAWRLGVREGDISRQDAAAGLRGRYGEVEIEASRVDRQSGLRGQIAFGLVWIGGGLHATTPIRDSFALVDAGVAGVSVLRENRRVGTTNAEGLILLPDLRPYERNRIGLEVDDLPEGATLTHDDLTVTPAARSGVVVRFPVEAGASGEVRVVDEAGVALPVGTVLASEGRRYPVGSQGRIYLSGVTAARALSNGGGCVAIVDRVLVEAGGVVVCGRAN